MSPVGHLCAPGGTATQGMLHIGHRTLWGCLCGAVGAPRAVPSGDVAHVRHSPQTENGTQA